MLTVGFLFLLLLSLVFLLLNYKKTGIWILGLTVLLFWLIGSGFLTNIAIKPLLFRSPNTLIWRERNAIIVLGGGTTKDIFTHRVYPAPFSYSRIIEGMRLYKSCKSITPARICRIIVSGSDVSKTGRSEAHAYQYVFLTLGVQPGDILLENHSRNTAENALFTRVIVKREGFNTIYLVTSGVHMKRAVLYFSQNGMDVIPAPSDALRTKMTLPISYNFLLANLVLHEYLGLLKFYFHR